MLEPFRVFAEANWGRWVVRCPRCPSALDGVPGDPAFRCWECGATAAVDWPPEATVAGVERLLLMRPDVTTRNWLPGETLIDLVVENAAHGIWDTDTPGELTVDDGRIRVDTLPLTHSAELKAIA